VAAGGSRWQQVAAGGSRWQQVVAGGSRWVVLWLYCLQNKLLFLISNAKDRNSTLVYLVKLDFV